MGKEDMIEKILENKKIFKLTSQIRNIDYLDMSKEKIWKELKTYSFNFEERRSIAKDIQEFKDYRNKLNNMMRFEIEEIGENLGLWEIKEKQRRLI